MSEPMNCPSCRLEMNHHCDKLVYGEKLDAEGVVLAFHTCPGCGECGSRPSEN